MTKKIYEPGQLAYETYSFARGYDCYWPEMKDDMRTAWAKVEEAVVSSLQLDEPRTLKPQQPEAGTHTVGTSGYRFEPDEPTRLRLHTTARLQDIARALKMPFDTFTRPRAAVASTPNLPPLEALAAGQTLVIYPEWIKERDRFGFPVRIEIPCPPDDRMPDCSPVEKDADGRPIWPASTPGGVFQRAEAVREPFTPPKAPNGPQEQVRPWWDAGIQRWRNDVPEPAPKLGEALSEMDQAARDRAAAILREQLALFKSFTTLFGHHPDDAPMLKHISLKVGRTPAYLDALVAQLAEELQRADRNA